MCLLHAYCAPGPVLGAEADIKARKPPASPACKQFQSVMSLGKCWESAAHFLCLLNGKVGVCLFFTSVILNVKPLRGFLVSFICPCFYFQFIMNSVFGKSLLYFAHLLFFAVTIIVMLSWYQMYFIIIFLSRAATLASAFWKINCFYHLYLRSVMHCILLLLPEINAENSGIL